MEFLIPPVPAAGASGIRLPKPPGRAPRRRRRGAVAEVPGQLAFLFDVAADREVEAADAAPAPTASPPAPAIRLVLLDAFRDAHGDPRPALLIPGRAAPAVFDGIAAALAAKAHLEAAAR
jgi:hypothetical protein